VTKKQFLDSIFQTTKQTRSCGQTTILSRRYTNLRSRSRSRSRLTNVRARAHKMQII